MSELIFRIPTNVSTEVRNAFEKIATILNGGIIASISVDPATVTGAAGTDASVTNTGDEIDVVLKFTIPRGDTGATGAAGEAATVAVHSTVTGAAGSSALVENMGSSSAANFKFTIPRGDTGAAGASIPEYPGITQNYDMSSFTGTLGFQNGILVAET